MKQMFLITLSLSVVLWANMSKTGNIVTDSETLLQWQDDAVRTRLDWSSALAYCEGLTLDDYSDWRLPNIIELTSVIDDTKVRPSISPVFRNISSAGYWSSTTYLEYNNEAWGIDFSVGDQEVIGKGAYYSNTVFCVRAGQ